MRLNLNRIVQNIREAYAEGGEDAVSGNGGKSSAYNYALSVARAYFPDITWEQAIAIAKGDANVRWNSTERTIDFVPGVM